MVERVDKRTRAVRQRFAFQRRGGDQHAETVAKLMQHGAVARLGAGRQLLQRHAQLVFDRVQQFELAPGAQMICWRRRVVADAVERDHQPVGETLAQGRAILLHPLAGGEIFLLLAGLVRFLGAHEGVLVERGQASLQGLVQLGHAAGADIFQQTLGPGRPAAATGIWRWVGHK